MQTLLVFIVAFYRVAPVHMTGVGIGIYEDFAEDDVFLKTEKKLLWSVFKPYATWTN